MKVKSANEDDPTTQTNQTPRKLVSLGRDAAIKSIRILSALQAENLIGEYISHSLDQSRKSSLTFEPATARFGFFDLDATFSAAFILVMIGILEGTTAGELPMEIQLACQVLLYLSEAGNRVASEKLGDIVRFCASIWGINEDTILPGRSHAINFYPGSSSVDHSQVHGAFVFPLAETPAVAASDTHQPSGFADTRSDMTPTAHHDFRSLDMAHNDLGTLSGQSDVSFTNEAQCIYTSFNEPDFSLTGFDHGDWMEMEKIIGNHF